MTVRLTLRAAVCALLITVTAACNLTQNPPTPTPRASITPPVSLTLSSGTPIPAVTPIDLSSPVPGGTGGTTGDCTQPPGWIVYTIEPGDSLGDLAEATGSTVETIAAANCIADPSAITAGQQIFLPTEPVVG